MDYFSGLFDFGKFIQSGELNFEEPKGNYT